MPRMILAFIPGLGDAPSGALVAFLVTAGVAALVLKSKLAALTAAAGAVGQPVVVAPAGPQEGRLCSQCHGRCCSQGGPTNAFIKLPQLVRWQQREAGRTLQDAVAYYMAALPPRHTQHACVYQGPQGCSLPRRDRAEICNSYACDSLQQMRLVLRTQPEAAFAVVTLEDDEARRRAAITADGSGLEVLRAHIARGETGAASGKGFYQWTDERRAAMRQKRVTFQLQGRLPSG